jgi:hypothetical protein
MYSNLDQLIIRNVCVFMCAHVCGHAGVHACVRDRDQFVSWLIRKCCVMVFSVERYYIIVIIGTVISQKI